MKGEKSMENETIITALSLIGTLAGSFGGILVSSKLTNYRIEQLEKKVDKHNNFAERLPVIEEKLKDHDRRLSEVEHETA